MHFVENLISLQFTLYTEQMGNILVNLTWIWFKEIEISPFFLFVLFFGLFQGLGPVVEMSMKDGKLQNIIEQLQVWRKGNEIVQGAGV